MKFKGKILSLLIVASLVVSSMFSVGLAANYSDVDESSSYYQSISLLSALGLLKDMKTTHLNRTAISPEPSLRLLS
jgi:hypothetical protein